MKNIKIKIDDRIEIEISPVESICIISNYTDGCTMTINYPEGWNYTRVIQHALTISEAIISPTKII